MRLEIGAAQIVAAWLWLNTRSHNGLPTDTLKLAAAHRQRRQDAPAATELPGQRKAHTVDGTPGSRPYCRSEATAARALGGLDPAESTVPSHVTRRVDHPNE
jgi:hypothetical protein